jgi:apolipoprotein N-acyltransferase
MTATLEVAKLALKADKDPSVQQIIASARSRQQPAVDRPASLGAWLLSSLSMVLLWASFTPVDCGPLAWIALVPLCVLSCAC